MEYGQGGQMTISTHTELEAEVDLAIVAFLCNLGWSDFYFKQIRSGFMRRPALLVLATTEDPHIAVEPKTSIQGLLYAEPVDGSRASMSRCFVAPSRQSEIGMMAALHKAALEHLAEYGLRARLLVSARDELTRVVLEWGGFAAGELVEGWGGSNFVSMEIDPDRGLDTLGLREVTFDDLFSTRFGLDRLEHPLLLVESLLQLSGLSQPPGTVTNPLASEPGYPPEPSPPSPSPGPNGGSEPGTP